MPVLLDTLSLLGLVSVTDLSSSLLELVPVVNVPLVMGESQKISLEVNLQPMSILVIFWGATRPLYFLFVWSSIRFTLTVFCLSVWIRATLSGEVFLLRLPLGGVKVCLDFPYLGADVWRASAGPPSNWNMKRTTMTYQTFYIWQMYDDFYTAQKHLLHYNMYNVKVVKNKKSSSIEHKIQKIVTSIIKKFSVFPEGWFETQIIQCSEYVAIFIPLSWS